MMEPHHVVAQVIALSVVEWSFDRRIPISVVIDDTNASVSDGGRGMGLVPDPGDDIPHAQRVLTSDYPIHADDPVVNAVLGSCVWGDEGPCGPARANVCCEQLSFRSRRSGEEWAQAYRRGVPTGAAHRVGATDLTGTTIELTTAAPIDAAAVLETVAQLEAGLPGLRIDVSVST